MVWAYIGDGDNEDLTGGSIEFDDNQESDIEGQIDIEEEDGDEGDGDGDEGDGGGDEEGGSQ